MNKNWKPLLIVLGLSTVFFGIFVAVSLSYVGRDGGKTAKHGLGIGREAVGVIELNGVITSSKKFLEGLDELKDRDAVKALVVRINSPGGAVAPSQEIYEALRKFPKPVVASMSSVAASGGYYVAMAAQKVYANPGTITGSIGVIMEFANMERLYDWARIKRFSIKTGKFKDAGAEYREMTSEERSLLQGMVDDVLKQFRQAVVVGRKMHIDRVTQLSDGRIFSGNQAYEAKLVDELGTLDDAVKGAGTLAGIKGEPRVITYKKKRKFMEELLDGLDGGGDEEDAESRSPIGSLLAGLVSRSLGLEARKPLAPGVYWLWRGGTF